MSVKFTKDFINFLLLTTVAYVIAVFFKFSLVFEYPLSFYPPLWGADGGLYGYYAKNILAGGVYPVDAEHMPGWLLVGIVKLFHVSLDTALFYSSAFLSSLSVVPVMMIGYYYKRLDFAFIVAILGSLTYSYYIRSFLGYYDTDSLNIFFPMMIIAFMIWSMRDMRYLIGSIVFAILFFMWYHSCKVIIFALFVNFAVYVLVVKYRVYVRKYWWLLLGVGLAMGLALYYQTDFFHRVYDYFIKPAYVHEGSYIFKNTLATVSEAKPLAISKLGEYLSINNIYFYLSLVGLLLMWYRYRETLLLLPMLLLGLISVKSGIRFSEYGAYVLPFGLVYMVCMIVYWLKLPKYSLHFLSVVLVGLYFNVIYKTNKTLHPILSYDTAVKLRILDKNLHKKDFILTWWDYGWALWYYTKANTLIDNGKHLEDNYIISKLLLSPQAYTALAARYFMQKCEDRHCHLMHKLLQHHDFTPRAIKPTKDVYFFFHDRMLRIIKTIMSFSTIDPITAKVDHNRYLSVLTLTKKGSILSTKHNQIQINLINHTLRLKNKTIPILFKKYPTALVGVFNKTHIIVYKNTYLLFCNDKVFNSFFIQAFVLRNFDKHLYKKVAGNYEMMILKLQK
ncbi:MAG: hypothetical protein GXO40_02030 [Epsilonproteobacteria bacterium]|nr:hypothetical protein [Campylobacterota bacterium]